MSDRLEQLRRMLESDPSDPFCLYAMGMEHIRLGEDTAAAAHLEQSLASDPAQPYAHFHRARCLARLGRSADALAAVEMGLEEAQAAGDHKAADELAGLQAELSS